ncbi:MAG: pseudouridine synthase [Cytophagales bacterium]|nr:pseudouridine synthase [Cytophagales bacterium]
MTEPTLIRLNKRMAELGLASRREADDWIARGWVRVNGAPAVLGQPVPADAQIEIHRQAASRQAEQVTVVLHKPIGFVSGQAEDGYEPAKVLVVPAQRWDDDPSRKGSHAVQFHPSHWNSLVPAGRLDIDSTGLLILTQDGRVARTLIGEDSAIEKEYLVRVSYRTQERGLMTVDIQSIFPPEQLAKLRHGLHMDGKPLKPARVDWQNPEQLRFVLNEGKKRQIRRMCEAVGLTVVGLKRVRIGKLMLGNLPLGQWRYLRPDERF